MLERLAEWYLWKRGRWTLPRTFIGLIVGGGIANQREDQIWEVYVPPGFQYGALSGTTMNFYIPPNDTLKRDTGG